MKTHEFKTKSVELVYQSPRGTYENLGFLANRIWNFGIPVASTVFFMKTNSALFLVPLVITALFELNVQFSKKSKKVFK